MAKRNKVGSPFARHDSCELRNRESVSLPPGFDEIRTCGGRAGIIFAGIGGRDQLISNRRDVDSPGGCRSPGRWSFLADVDHRSTPGMIKMSQRVRTGRVVSKKHGVHRSS